MRQYLTETEWRIILHKRISYVKSVIRIKGGLLFIAGSLGWTGARYMWIAGALCFIVAEIGGILEEVYGA